MRRHRLQLSIVASKSTRGPGTCKGVTIWKDLGFMRKVPQIGTKPGIKYEHPNRFVKTLCRNNRCGAKCATTIFSFKLLGLQELGLQKVKLKSVIEAYPAVPAGLVETWVLSSGVSFEIPKSATFAINSLSRRILLGLMSL